MTTLAFETLDQALQAAVDIEEALQQDRLTSAAIATTIKEGFGPAGLNSLAQTIHKKRSTLEADIAAFAISDLLEDRPTLTWIHLNILRLIQDVKNPGKAAEERKSWADKASDQNWSPADLRRHIAASRRQPVSPDVVVHKAKSTSEKLKGIADEAEEVGVLPQVEEQVESVTRYIEAKKREPGSS